MSDETDPTPSPEQETPPPVVQETTTPPTTDGTKAELSVKDAQLFSMLAHILGGVTNVLAPLIIWLVKKDESPLVNDQAKEALNFQITILIGYASIFILTHIPFLGAVVGCLSIIIFPLLWAASIIFGIIGGLEVQKGKQYRYPFALRLIK